MDQEHLYKEATSDLVLLNKINEKRKDGIGVDCTIEAKSREDKSLIRKGVHRVVVSSASKYCERIFEGSVDTLKIVIPHTVSELALEEFIGFLYTNRLRFSRSTAADLIFLSRSFEMSSQLESFVLQTLHDKLKTEEECKWLIDLARKFNRDITAGMDKWIHIHACHLYHDFKRPVKKCEQMWMSATDLLKKSEFFQHLWTIIDVLQWINLDQPDILFHDLFKNILPNELVQKDRVAVKYVAHCICTKAESDSHNIALSNCFPVWNLRKTHFLEDEFLRLQVILRKFMAENFSKMALNSEFLAISPQEMDIVLKSSDFQSSSYRETFDGLVVWIKYKRTDVEKFPAAFDAIIDTLFFSNTSKTDQYLKFLEKIELRNFTCDFILSKVEKNQLTQKHEDAAAFVSHVICSKLNSDISELTVNNCFIIRRMIKNLLYTNLTNLDQRIHHFIGANLEILAKNDELYDLEVDELACVLGSASPSFEQEKVELILKWVDSKDGRKKSFPDLFITIKIHSLPNQFIKTMSLNPLIAGNNMLLQQVIGALCDYRPDSEAFPQENETSNIHAGDSHSLLQGKAEGGKIVEALEQLHVDQRGLLKNGLDCEIASTISDAPSHSTDSTGYSFPTASYESGRSSPYGSELGADLHGSGESSGYNTHFSAAAPPI